MLGQFAAGVGADFKNVTFAILVLLVVAEDKDHGSHEENVQGADRQDFRGELHDEVHDIHVGDLGDPDVVTGSRAERGRRDRTDDGRTGDGGLEACADHKRDHRGAESRGATGGGRNGDGHEGSDEHAEGQQEDAQTAQRLHHEADEVYVASRDGDDGGKAHGRTD